MYVDAATLSLYYLWVRTYSVQWSDAHVQGIIHRSMDGIKDSASKWVMLRLVRLLSFKKVAYLGRILPSDWLLLLLGFLPNKLLYLFASAVSLLLHSPPREMAEREALGAAWLKLLILHEMFLTNEHGLCV